ncbi:hypothetical protein [Blastococcus sp. SYSU D01042]
MSEVLRRGPRRRPRYRYELRVRTVLGPALAAALTRRPEGAVIPRGPARRLALVPDGDRPVDLAAVVQRLTECDVAVLEVRRRPAAVLPERGVP